MYKQLLTDLVVRIYLRLHSLTQHQPPNPEHTAHQSHMTRPLCRMRLRHELDVQHDHNKNYMRLKYDPRHRRLDVPSETARQLTGKHDQSCQWAVPWEQKYNLLQIKSVKLA